MPQQTVFNLIIFHQAIGVKYSLFVIHLENAFVFKRF